MRPDRIFEIMDLALEARKAGLIFNPMFRGDAGLGKSAIVQQWVAAQRERNPDFFFLDLRIAYYESPDLIGFPKEIQVELTDKDGKRQETWRTTHCLPDFWPTSGEGLILFEEPNRGTTGVMNCLMQILTDRQVTNKYKIPEKAIMAACINPDTAKYDVNNMDTALMDRFEIFDVDYDHNTFVTYIEANKWHKNPSNYVKSGVWVYKKPEAIGKEGKYISPRTWSKLNAAEMAGVSSSPEKRALHRIVCQSILGVHIGNEYWKFCWDDAPILASDIILDREKSIHKIKQQAKNNDTYAGDKIALTVDSIIESYGGWHDKCEFENDKDKIDEKTMVEIAEIIPSDQAVNLIKGCGFKVHRGKVTTWFKDFYVRNPKCIAIMRDNIKLDRALNK